jgi:hypothetical protein
LEGIAIMPGIKNRPSAFCRHSFTDSLALSSGSQVHMALRKAGIRHIITNHHANYRIFGCFELIGYRRQSRADNGSTGSPPPAQQREHAETTEYGGARLGDEKSAFAPSRRPL